MARLSKEELTEIVEHDMPGYQLVESAARQSDAAPSSALAADPTPDLDALRRKYLGGADTDSPSTSNAPSYGAESASVTEGETDEDTEIVVVEPKEIPDAWSRGARPKAIVISSKDKRIIGSQG